MSGGKVYKGIGPNEGQIVPESEAFEYACDKAGVSAFCAFAPEAQEFREMLVEWYFSGNWIYEYESEADSDGPE